MLGHGAIGQYSIGEVGQSAPPENITLDKWYIQSAPPVRFPAILIAAAQHFGGFDPGPPIVPFSWDRKLTEPYWQKPRLIDGAQQFLAWPPRLLPTPSITASMAATESLDTFIGSIREYSAVVSAATSILEMLQTRSPVGVIENTHKSASVGVQASLPISASGSPLPPTYTARVAVNEV